MLDLIGNGSLDDGLFISHVLPPIESYRQYPGLEKKKNRLSAHCLSATVQVGTATEADFFLLKWTFILDCFH